MTRNIHACEVHITMFLDIRAVEENEVVERSKDILIHLENYKGCGESIKKAINNWSDHTLQRQGYDAVSPNIQLVSGFHEIADTIGIAYLWL